MGAGQPRRAASLCLDPALGRADDSQIRELDRYFSPNLFTHQFRFDVWISLLFSSGNKATKFSLVGEVETTALSH